MNITVCESCGVEFGKDGFTSNQAYQTGFCLGCMADGDECEIVQDMKCPVHSEKLKFETEYEDGWFYVKNVRCSVEGCGIASVQFFVDAVVSIVTYEEERQVEAFMDSKGRLI